ncbi:MAG: SNF2-related protein [Dehalococcoidia bacterium]
MLVLHGTWIAAHKQSPAGFAVWGETAPPQGRRSTRRKTAAASRNVGPHPFAASESALREALHTLSPRLNADEVQPTSVVALLPSDEAAPLPSPDLPLDSGPVTTTTASDLRAWQAPALILNALTAVNLLLPLTDGEQTQAIVLGEDLRFWSEAGRFALELVSRQRLLPAIERQQNLFFARWRPLLDEERDIERLLAMTKGMLPACRAVFWKEEQPTSGARMLLRNFLDDVVDAVARQAKAFTAAAVPPARRKTRAAPRPKSLADAWLQALEGGPLVQADPREFSVFYDRYQAWSKPGGATEQGAFRVCFRLDPPFQDFEEDAREELETALHEDDAQVHLAVTDVTASANELSVPDTDERNWTLEYLLQATDDPSLLVPASDVWRQRGDSAQILNRRLDNPQEHLLAGLGQASRLFPPIEESLRTARPNTTMLTVDQAYDFLKEKAVLLKASGFGVLVPGLEMKLGVRLRLGSSASSATKSTGPATFGWESLVSYNWQLAVGDQTLSRAEFETLAKLKQPLVQVRGRWVELRPEQIERALAFFKRQDHGSEMSLQDALRLALAPDGEHGLPVVEVNSEGWIDDLLRELREGGKREEIDEPAGFHGVLRPYQKAGVSWLAGLRRYGLGACLADDMGLGKCVDAGTLLEINGQLSTAESAWTSFAGAEEFDGEGSWAAPSHPAAVNALDEATGRLALTPIRRLYRQHVQEKLRKVTLEDGSCIITTRRHRLLTSNGWSNALQVGDYICVPARTHWAGTPVDPDLVTLLAWQIAEGHEYPQTGSVEVTQKAQDRLEDLLRIIRRIGQRYDLKINRPCIAHYPPRVSSLRLNSMAYRHFLEARGYSWGKLSRDKSIPPVIMQADHESIRLFLRNYFEAEGSAIESMRSIEVSSASTVLMQQLVVLLRRFGIWIRVSAKQKRATNGTGILRTYYIGVVGGSSLRRYLHEIGFVSEEKQGRLEAICGRTTNTNVEGMPASEPVADLLQRTGLPLRHSGRHNPVDLDKDYLQSARFQLRRLCEQEVFYCRIKSIDDVDYRGWVYDFEVEEHHNFVANNILCHNTVQTLSLLLHERSNKQAEEATPTLLICPTSVVGNWRREIERFAPGLRTLVHHGAGRSKEEFAEAAMKYDIVISTYALLHRDEAELSAVEWDNVVLDEAQNIKNPATRAAQTARRLKTRWRATLTGTPVENRLTDLWSIFQFLNPGYLGSAVDFRKRFATPIERAHDADATARLRLLVSPFILRRLKTDRSIIQDLPEKNEMKVYCTLTREQATLYEAVVRESVRQIEEAEGIARRGIILATLAKLKQVCDHPALFLHDGSSLSGRSGKLTRLTEMLEEVLSLGERALIFTQYAEMGRYLKEHLETAFTREALFLHGGTPAKQRDQMVARFQAEGRGPQIFVLSIKAGGTGLNLTHANHVFHFDRWWNPAVENQATDRAFRIGQRRDVQVHKYICAGTFEEVIDNLIERKVEIAQSITGTSEAWITEMSTEDLRNLFALRHDTATAG